jgi:hypothetical protein
MNQVSTDRRRKAAESCRRTTIGEGKSGGPKIRGHDFREEDNHRTAVGAVEKGEPKLYGKQARKRGRICQKQEYRIGRKQRDDT